MHAKLIKIEMYLIKLSSVLLFVTSCYDFLCLPAYTRPKHEHPGDITHIRMHVIQ